VSLRLSDVAVAFATFQTIGCRPPESHSSEAGLDFALRTWQAILDDLDRDELLELVVAYCRTPSSKFWPTPGELLALRTVDDDDALEQWGRLLEQLGRRGRDRPPTRASELEQVRAGSSGSSAWALAEHDLELDAAIHAGLEALGGWRAACLMHDGQAVANRAAFRDAYRNARRRTSRRLERRAVAAITSSKIPQITGASE
jgi:hypothetical protein